MVAIPVPAPLAPLVWAVGMHGVTDAWTHRAMVPAYLLAAPPWPHTTALFTLASVVHFSEDVGPRASLALHACIVAAAAASVPAALALTLAYLCAVHVPRHAARVERHAGPQLVAAMWALGALVMALDLPADAIPDAAQRVACVHIGLHAVRPLTPPRRRR